MHTLDAMRVPVKLFPTVAFAFSLLSVARIEVASAETWAVSDTAKTWAIQNVDAGSSSAAPTSVGLVQGYPVISYFGSPHNLRYAALNPQTKVWNLLRVDAGGEFTSLAVDPAGVVHVAYLDAVTLQLNYWRNNLGQGSIQLIDSETGQGGMGFYNSIRADDQGTPHVSYYYSRSPDGSTTADRLKYAELNGSTWQTVFADPTPGRGRYNSLAIDAATNNPQIAYYDRTAKVLRLAKRIANLWTTQGVDSAGDPGRFNSIALNASGLPRISYIAATPLQLRYASFNGALWTFEDVGGVGLVGDRSVTSLKLDSSGNPHISYYDAAAGALKYASRSAGGVWTIQTVDDVGDVGWYSSLVLDSQNRPIISYLDGTSQALKIAYGDYPDQDNDGIPDAFDPCPTNPDCNSNGVVDGKEGGVQSTDGAFRLKDEPIFGCGSLAALSGFRPPGGGPPPPFDLLALLAPGVYLLLRRFCNRRAA